jgi:hypothetical protein
MLGWSGGQAGGCTALKAGTGTEAGQLGGQSSGALEGAGIQASEGERHPGPLRTSLHPWVSGLRPGAAQAGLGRLFALSLLPGMGCLGLPLDLLLGTGALNSTRLH